MVFSVDENMHFLTDFLAFLEGPVSKIHQKFRILSFNVIFLKMVVRHVYFLMLLFA